MIRKQQIPICTLKGLDIAIVLVLKNRRGTEQLRDSSQYDKVQEFRPVFQPLNVL